MELETPNFKIQIDADCQSGRFEHKKLGPRTGGRLWFKGKELDRFDGMFSLPKEVITALRRNGYVCKFIGHH